jgi:signal transduction histidine kinase
LLDTTLAYLVPAGSTAALVSPQTFPASPGAQPPDLGPLAREIAGETRLIVPLAPEQYGGASWAVPLWRERGLIGILLIGPRRQGGLYTQEEIEIARSAGERLIDTAASLALSQRLVQIQRERMAATQILDQRTRRVLHDEVLPLIHTAMLSIASRDPLDPAIQHLSDAHGQVSDLLRELPPAVRPELARLGLLGALRKVVEVEFAQAFDEVSWRCEDGIEARAAGLSPLAAETLFFAAREVVRNAAKHGRPGDASARLCLAISAQAGEGRLQITVEDNGPGLRQEPPPQNTEKTRMGEGLALHSTLMAIVGGSLALERIPGQMTRVQLALPLA